MKIFHYTDVKAKDAGADTLNLNVRWLISKEIGAKNFAMRLFEMNAGGFSPLHHHDWEHEIFILGGKGIVTDGKRTFKFKAGDAIFIPPNEKHQLKNNGQEACTFLCLIPYEKQ